MKKEDIFEMHNQEKTYWWHVSRRFILESVLNKYLCVGCPSSCFFCHSERSRGISTRLERTVRYGHGSLHYSRDDRVKGRDDRSDIKTKNKINILDVGCGTGANFGWLNKFGDVVGIDSNQEAVKFCQDYGNAIIGKAEKIPVKNNNYDLLTAFDILEHTVNDLDVLQEWKRVLRPNGYLYITVPAYQWLFGPHDKQLMHYRRYLLSKLLKKLKQSGFTPIFASYFFMFTFPLLVFQRLIAKIFNITPGYNKMSNGINNLLIKITNLESNLLQKTSLPFGSSIIILARKNETTDN